MSMLELALWGWGTVARLMCLLFLKELLHKDASIVDVGWSLGVGALGIVYALFGPGDPTRRAILGAVASIWAFRLAFFLFVNRVWGKKEDGRYQRLRAHWGKRASLYFFLFFQIQAIWTLLFAIPFMVVAANPQAAPTPWDWLGIAIAIVAIVGEGIADAQLAKWRGDPANKGKTCRAGLWRYSRHPNYFFEWTHWFAYVALAVGSPWWYLAFIGPILMIVFLFKITGIPHTEKQALASRGEDYRRYQRETSVFIPWFPRKA